MQAARPPFCEVSALCERPALRPQAALALFRAGQREEALRVLNDLAKTAPGPLGQEIKALSRRWGQTRIWD